MANWYSNNLSEIKEVKIEEIQLKIEELKLNIQDVISEINKGTPTTKKLVNDELNEKHFKFVMEDPHNLYSPKIKSFWLNNSVSKLKMCQRSICILSNYLVKHYKYLNSVKTNGYRPNVEFSETTRILNLLDGIYQNLAIACDDYLRILNNIISEEAINYRNVEGILVSERISKISRETEKLLIMNPTSGTVGFAAIRIFLENYIFIITIDKIRSHLRINMNNNMIDVKFTDDFYGKKDILLVVKTLFPEINTDVIRIIYEKSSASVHNAIAFPNYVIWTCWNYIYETLISKFDSIDTKSSKELKNLINILQTINKLCIIIKS